MFGLHGLALGSVLHNHHAHDKTPTLDVRAIPAAAITSAPGSAYDEAKVALRANDLPTALAGFRRAVRETPQSIDALNGLAVVYDLLGQFEQSAVFYQAALAVDPGSATVASNYGYSLYLQGDMTGADRLLRQAAASDDATAVASSRHTLHLMAVAAATPRPAVPQMTAQTWVEQTGDGEQRLVLDRKTDVAAGDAALVSAATAWTAADEARATRIAALEARAARATHESGDNHVNQQGAPSPARLAAAGGAIAQPRSAEAAVRGRVDLAVAEPPSRGTTPIATASDLRRPPTPEGAVVAALHLDSGYRLHPAASMDQTRRRRGGDVAVDAILARRSGGEQPTASAPATGLDVLASMLRRVSEPAGAGLATEAAALDRLAFAFGGSATDA